MTPADYVRGRGEENNCVLDIDTYVHTVHTRITEENFM